MKQVLCFLLGTGCLFISAKAQLIENTGKNQAKGKSNSVSGSIDIPFGDFFATHGLGTGVNYSWSNHRYGQMMSAPTNPIGFTFNIDAEYYFGKKESIGLFNYDYSGYTYLHAYGGGIYNFSGRGNISLTAGPALGLYSGHSQFNFGADLSGSYYFNKRIAITPVIIFMKESGSDPLWSGSVRAGFSF
jgi:hypothetical protein